MESAQNEVDLIVILPCFQKSHEIGAVVQNLSDVLNGTNLKYRLLIVDDGSTIPVSIPNNDVVLVVRHELNRGKGAALRTGITLSRSKLIAFFDSDLDIDPSCLPPMIFAVLLGQCELAIASKRHPASNIFYPKLRVVLSRSFYFIQRILFNLPPHDTQTGAKVLGSHAIEEMRKTTEKGFLIDLELVILLNAKKYRISEFPVSIEHKFSSTIRVRDILMMARGIANIYSKYRKIL